MMTNLDTGRVRIRLSCADHRVVAAQIGSERPDVSRILHGRTVLQTERMVPLLFALCGRAQAQAARLALAAARGSACAVTINDEVRREALREHLWRCLIDLPPLLGEAPLQQGFVSAVHCVNEGKRTELLQFLDTSAVTRLRERVEQMPEIPVSAMRILPTLDAASSLAEWPRLDGGFSRRPEWRGMPAVTGAGARGQQAHAGFFAAHWLARFAELAEWAGGWEGTGRAGSASAAVVAQGVGRSLVETARGLLMHEVVLDGDLVAEYLIVAPTEWNFHPQGALHDCLLGADAQDRQGLERHIVRLVATLDPCVPWELEWA
ncbi:MAG TPA: nickel-dependent hydrogenase large subunit [Sideroxyarcus sp.]|nr:nickel-dependent hydrogenase large subunit [Sideroxyarcus sp.]